MRAIRLGGRIIRALVRDRVYYSGRLMVETAGLLARCGVLLVLYNYVFRLNGGTINKTSYIIAAWSIFFYFAFSSFRLRDISRTIMRDVQSGAVEVLFSKPISYVAYRMWWQIGEGLYPFAIISAAGSIVLAIAIGVPSTMMLTIFIPTLILAILLGSLLSLALYTCIGLLAFWIEDVNPVFWIVDKMVMILGGSYLPVALFPEYMYKISMWSPFGATQFITHTVYETWTTDWFIKSGIQAAWIVIIWVLVAVLFTKARQKVSINGG